MSVVHEDHTSDRCSLHTCRCWLLDVPELVAYHPSLRIFRLFVAKVGSMFCCEEKRSFFLCGLAEKAMLGFLLKQSLMQKGERVG